MMAIEIATSEEIADLKRLVVGLTGKVETLALAFEAQMQDRLPEWLTVREAADYLRLTPDTVRRKVRAGHFDTRRDGKNILIHRQCLLDQSSRRASSSAVSL